MITYPPIKFECQLSGKKLIAEVTTQVTGADRFDFRTRFSDGFEDIFSHEGNRGAWKAANDRKLRYLQLVKDDLAALQSYQPSRHYLSFRYTLGQQVVNIWVFETLPEEGRPVYSIYYKGEYQFDLTKVRGSWSGKSVRQKSPPIDTSLVSAIGQMIDEKMRGQGPY